MKRREFLKKSLATAGMLSLSTGIGMRNLAMAAGGDYKALVCVFLAGGNDSHNMLIPTFSTRYDEYSAAKGALAIDKSQLVNLAMDGELALGAHPALSPLSDLFNQGKMTAIINTGNLIAAGDRSAFEAKSVPSISRLGSHADMQAAKRSGFVGGEIDTGWAGRLLDTLASPVYDFSPGYSTGEETNFLLSNSYQQILLSESANINAFGLAEGLEQAFKDDMVVERTNLFRQQINLIKQQMLSSGAQLDPLLEAELSTSFPKSSLANNLSLVAKVLKGNAALNQQRQVFYVVQGGYDTHNNQLVAQDRLYQELAEALAAFQGELDASGLGSNVTTFTMSDFGRSQLTNGTGTAHGWAGHELVMGDAVIGGRYYGDMPDLIHDGNWSINNNGRMIPTTSADQVAATLAHWFGTPTDSLDNLFPNLANFNQKTLGFLS
ncbi:DUF1501 domain-containing protein [Photobacterium sp. DNB23_23_1]|uniref:DUF1501 domain-containing protein n=1 Tax=Photobacterium pectinilyticum TaxID=2906793 RepID=A0ABT1N1T7_9GAMM|nr:DUF1501 domain-containing protein [Photobacterium sp. ZSDE20]MCQ1058675.1 DUF1501 domain-containing protein [Photobacterium sp. ZSDE20]MDD1823389.1 DUF1501 domain-containing protein [Photobacterium sp. ZSDE20]